MTALILKAVSNNSNNNDIRDDYGVDMKSYNEYDNTSRNDGESCDQNGYGDEYDSNNYNNNNNYHNENDNDNNKNGVINMVVIIIMTLITAWKIMTLDTWQHVS